MKKDNNIANLLKNKSFVQWLKKGKDTSSDNWEKWQADSSENQRIAEDARMILKGIPFNKARKNTVDSQASFKQLSNKLSNQNTAKVIQPRRNWLKIAAAVAVLIIAGIVANAYLNQAQLVEYETAFAENKSITLPDGSIVTLAASSYLSYYDDFETTQKRIVELDGEAYFDVAPQKEGKKFIVQVKDLDIEVVGTAFNVNSHRSAAIVSLVEGKVQLTNEENRIHQLVAGQTAHFDRAKSQYIVETGKTDYWSAWRSQKWILEETSVEEITQRISETLGLIIQVENEDIYQRKTSGEISIDNPTVLFESLAFLLDVKIEQVGDTLIIKDVEE